MQKNRERKSGIDEGRKSEKRDNAKRMKELKKVIVKLTLN